jgi:hypothetical protein
MSICNSCAKLERGINLYNSSISPVVARFLMLIFAPPWQKQSDKANGCLIYGFGRLII